MLELILKLLWDISSSEFIGNAANPPYLNLVYDMGKGGTGTTALILVLYAVIGCFTVYLFTCFLQLLQRMLNRE